MQSPMQITFHGADPSPTLRALVDREAAALERFHAHLTTGRVAIELPHHHHTKGNRWQVKVELAVPGGPDVVVTRESRGRRGDDVYAAVRDAFDVARRQVQDRLHRQRGDVKTHEEAPTARIAELYPYEQCGYLATDDGRSIYFHRNAVLAGAFDDLGLGDRVSFLEEDGVKGPQASTVRLVAPAPRHPSDPTTSYEL